MTESYFEHFMKCSNPNDYQQLIKRLQEPLENEDQMIINQSNIALIKLLQNENYSNYVKEILPLKSNDRVYLIYNKAVGLLHNGKPTEALKYLSDLSTIEEENPVRFQSMLLYHHIVISLRALQPDLEPITTEFLNTIYVPGTINYIQSQLVLMASALRENDTTKALLYLNGVCNSIRDSNSKPYYQALHSYLSCDYDNAKNALSDGVSPLKEVNAACALVKLGQPAIATHMLSKAFDMFTVTPKIHKTTLENPEVTIYPVAWKHTTSYNLALCYLLSNKPIDAHNVFVELTDYYRYSPLLWYRLANCCIIHHYNYMCQRTYQFKHIGVGASRHIAIICPKNESTELSLSLGLQYIRNMATLIRGSTNQRLLLALYSAMGYISYWLEDYSLSKFCWEQVHEATQNNELKQSALIYLANTLCLLHKPKEAQSLLQSHFFLKQNVNTDDANYALALALTHTGNYPTAYSVINKMKETSEIVTLKVFLALSMGNTELAASIIRKAAPITQFNDPIFTVFM
ncbi:Tetratricopeptide repeat protein [Entamoeba marina]